VSFVVGARSASVIRPMYFSAHPLLNLIPVKTGW
jgi:hypothetical protein